MQIRVELDTCISVDSIIGAYLIDEDASGVVLSTDETENFVWDFILETRDVNKDICSLIQLVVNMVRFIKDEDPTVDIEKITTQ